MQLLLEMGAEVHVRAQDGSTALHIASYNGEMEIVRQLLDHGAWTESKTEDGQLKALHTAVFMGYR